MVSGSVQVNRWIKWCGYMCLNSGPSGRRHPDKNAGDEEAAEMFIKISKAHDACVSRLVRGLHHPYS
jgi:hypothetical protein